MQLRCEDAEGEASCDLGEQQSAACGAACGAACDAACEGAARGSTGTEPAAVEQASAGASNAVAADAGSTEAEAAAVAAGSTAAAAGSSADAPETGRSRQGQGGRSAAAEAERMGAVRRLSKQFSEQVTPQFVLQTNWSTNKQMNLTSKFHVAVTTIWYSTCARSMPCSSKGLMTHVIHTISWCV